MSIEPLAKGRISVVGGAVALVIITQQAMQEVIWFKHFIFFYESCLNLLSGGYSVETYLTFLYMISTHRLHVMVIPVRATRCRQPVIFGSYIFN